MPDTIASSEIQASNGLSSPETPRIPPIERPSSWVMRLAYWFTRRQFGTVITPMKVIYARMPRSLRLARAMVDMETKGLTLDAELKTLIKTFVATLNGCAFCVDIAQAQAHHRNAAQPDAAHLSAAQFEGLLRYQTHEAFTDRERAALAYVEEATAHKAVADETFEELRRHFSEQEVVELTWLNAMENYYNLLNRPLNIGSDHLCALMLDEDRTIQ